MCIHILKYSRGNFFESQKCCASSILDVSIDLTRSPSVINVVNIQIKYANIHVLNSHPNYKKAKLKKGSFICA